MTASDHLNGLQFGYHGTDAALRPGAHIVSANELGVQPANSGEMVGDPDATYYTSTTKAAAGWGTNVYPVRALASHHDDPDAIDEGDRRSYGHLEVLPHTPESLAATHTNIAKNQAADAAMRRQRQFWDQSCAFCGQRNGAHPQPLLNRHMSGRP